MRVFGHPFSHPAVSTYSEGVGLGWKTDCLKAPRVIMHLLENFFKIQTDARKVWVTTRFWGPIPPRHISGILTPLPQVFSAENSNMPPLQRMRQIWAISAGSFTDSCQIQTVTARDLRFAALDWSWRDLKIKSVYWGTLHAPFRSYSQSKLGKNTKSLGQNL
jgi:hypothetical protein